MLAAQEKLNSCVQEASSALYKAQTTENASTAANDNATAGPSAHNGSGANAPENTSSGAQKSSQKKDDVIDAEFKDA